MSRLSARVEWCKEQERFNNIERDECIWTAVAEEAFKEPVDDFEQLAVDLGIRADLVIDAVGENIQEQAVKSLTDTTEVSSEFIRSFDKNINDTIADINDTIKTTNDVIFETAEQTAEDVQETFGKVNTFIEEKSIETSMNTDRVAKAVIDDIDTLSTEVGEDIALLTQEIAGDVDVLVQVIQDGIRTDIDTTVSAISEVAQESLRETDKAIEEITAATGEVTTEIGDLTETLDKGVIPPLIRFGNNFEDAWFMQSAEKARERVKEVEEKLVDPQQLLAKLITDQLSFKDIFFGREVASTFFGAVLAALQLAASNVLMGIQAAHIANSVKVEEMLQTLWSGKPIRPFSFPDSVSLSVRGHLESNKAEQEAAKVGFDSEHFNAATNGAETPLSVDQAANALFRGEINEDEFRSYLKRQAYNQGDSAILREISNLRPPIQDLITMSVRDVFSPAIVDEFDLFAELPPRFVEEANKSGMTGDWPEFYWGSHWKQPSADQGFRMFHRDVINEEQLELLIKALDVPPFWRDKLTAIAYRPITRVDIRRMLKMGVIDEINAEKRYRHLGMHPDDAKLMTEFAVSLIDDAELVDDIDPRDLTQAQIRQLFLQGTLSKQQSIDLLIESDYSPKGSLLLVGSWETNRTIKERTDLLKMVTAKAIRENLDITQIEILVSGLELTPDEREVIQREIVLRSAEFPSKPSKSELKAMVEGDIITRAEWVKTMQQHGYDLIWVERYAKLWNI